MNIKHNNLTRIQLIFIGLFLSQISIAQSLYFPPNTGSTWDTITPNSLGYCPTKIDSLYAFLETNNTKSFILLKDGKIVLEKYFGSHTASTPWQWASAGKTITAFMTGIAQQEGFLSIADSTSKYLGQGWTSTTPSQEKLITVRHQLTMTSGLDDEVADPFCTLNFCLSYKANAGTRWSYHNGPYTLLDRVIENATGQTLNNYTTNKLKNPIGMTGSFYSAGYNTVFFSNARSMARFGLLMLNNGTWNGAPIMTDASYFQQMITTSQNLNKSYGYLWWLNGKQSLMVPSSQVTYPGPLSPNAPLDMYVALGYDGQFINVVPSQNIVWIRMGEAPTSGLVPFLLNDQIWAYINELNCGEMSTSKPNDSTSEIFPNPTEDEITITSTTLLKKVEILDLTGAIIHTYLVNSLEATLPTNTLPTGCYFIKIEAQNQSIWTKKLVKK